MPLRVQIDLRKVCGACLCRWQLRKHAHRCYLVRSQRHGWLGSQHICHHIGCRAKHRISHCLREGTRVDGRRRGLRLLLTLHEQHHLHELHVGVRRLTVVDLVNGVEHLQHLALLVIGIEVAVLCGLDVSIHQRIIYHIVLMAVFSKRFHACSVSGRTGFRRGRGLVGSRCDRFSVVHIRQPVGQVQAIFLRSISN